MLIIREPRSRTLLVPPTFEAIVRRARSVTFTTLTSVIARLCSLLQPGRQTMCLVRLPLEPHAPERTVPCEQQARRHPYRLLPCAQLGHLRVPARGAHVREPRRGGRRGASIPRDACEDELRGRRDGVRVGGAIASDINVIQVSSATSLTTGGEAKRVARAAKRCGGEKMSHGIGALERGPNNPPRAPSRSITHSNQTT